MGQYLPVFALLGLAVVFAALSFLASRLLSPKKMTPAKSAPYECGIVPSREPPERFPVKFYLVAMIFIVFDIEVIFFYAYAVTSQALGGYGLAAVAAFVVLVFASLVYEIANGGLDWGPQVSRSSRMDPMRSSARTASTTVRRVGTEGRPEPVAVGGHGAGGEQPAGAGSEAA